MSTENLTVGAYKCLKPLLSPNGFWLEEMVNSWLSEKFRMESGSLYSIVKDKSMVLSSLRF